MRFNINGRICLELMIPFGLLGLFVVYLLFPYSLKVLDLVPSIVVYVTAIILLIVFVSDGLISSSVIKKFKTDPLNLRDTTEEIHEFIRKTLYNVKKNKK